MLIFSMSWTYFTYVFLRIDQVYSKLMATNQLDTMTKVYLGLVDVIFSIIIGVGFAQFVPITFQFKTFTILLAYTMVVGSWVGYHAAVKTSYKRPYRFFIDLILLYLYNYLIFFKTRKQLIL